MKVKDQFRTGWRNLSRQKLRTSLTIFAIVIGAVSVTVMLSLVTSAKSFLTDSYTKTGEIKRVIVTSTKGLSYDEARWSNSDGSGVKLTDDIAAQIKTVDNVENATPVIKDGGYINGAIIDGETKELKNTGLTGFIANGTINYELLEGKMITEADKGVGGMVSKSVANDLGYRGRYGELVGKTVEFQPRADRPINGVKLQIKVVGVYLSDDKDVSIDLDWAHSLQIFRYEPDQGTIDMCTNSNNPPPDCDKQMAGRTDDWIAQNGYSAIFVDMANKKYADQVVNDIENKFGVGAAAGIDMVKEQQNVFTIIGLVLGGIGGIALFVAAIGVINTMVMATLERTREIGIMRAIGATKKTVRRLFTVEAGVLGFMGGVFGVLISFGFATLLNQILNKQLEDNGLSARNVVSVPVGLALIVIAVTTGVGMLAGRLPARRAANLDPVEALRYE